MWQLSASDNACVSSVSFHSSDINFLSFLCYFLSPDLQFAFLFTVSTSFTKPQYKINLSSHLLFFNHIILFPLAFKILRLIICYLFM